MAIDVRSVPHYNVQLPGSWSTTSTVTCHISEHIALIVTSQNDIPSPRTFSVTESKGTGQTVAVFLNAKTFHKIFSTTT